MAKFCGVVGYAESREIDPGVWQEEFTERKYYGDFIRDIRRISNGENLNDNVSVSHYISIVADSFAFKSFVNIRYVEWAGVKWTATSVDVQRPRLLITLGEVYNGQTA